LYELLDLPAGAPVADSAFGLLRSDYSSKPAYSALMNLLHLLADPGPSYTGQQLNFTLTGDLSNVHHLLFQKRNGFFYLAMWVEESSYDVNTKKVITVPVHRIVIQTDGKVNAVGYSFDKSGALQTAALGSSTTHVVAANDSVTVLEIDRPRPVAPILHPTVIR